MIKYLIILTQITTYFVIGIPLKLIYRVKKKYSLEIDPSEKYIIVANHHKRIDPFLISYSFKFKDYLKLIPLRIITYQKLFDYILLRPFLVILGCIPTNKSLNKIHSNHSNSIIPSLNKLIYDNQTIFFFPEGKRIKNDKNIKIKTGASVVESFNKNIKIIPIKITYTKKRTNIEYKSPFKTKNKLNHNKKSKFIYNKILN